MAKRFTDTDLWKTQRWFRKLNPLHKLVFCYIKDQCNHSGFWKIDCSDLIEDLAIEDFDIYDFIESINIEFDKITGKRINKERVRAVKNNFLWITGFIQFQYEGKDKLVSWRVGAVRTALLFLQGIDLLDESINKGYITLNTPLLDGWQTVKDKDKDKDKDVVKGGVGEKDNFKIKKNGKSKSFFSGNFKAQGEELFAERDRKRHEELDRPGEEDIKSEE